jgi:DNA polymerase III epsilon subunit-like protein
MYLFFDTETTGIPLNYRAPVADLANWPRVVQLAFLVAGPTGERVEAREFVIKPDGYTIPADAARVHGITTERALAEGVAIGEALAAFAGALARTQVLVAHNLSFDENILGAEFLRAKLGNPLAGMKGICTMESSTAFCGIPGRMGRPKWPTLAELHGKLFGQGLAKAHAALADVETCAKCFFELRRRGVVR